MFDYIRIACAVPDTDVAAAETNTTEMIKYAAKAENEGVNIVVFPELSVTGYTCADLFFQCSLLESAKTQLLRFVKETAEKNIISIIGAPLVINDILFNCAVVVSNGKIYGIVPKTFIPDYSEFYEKRWFASISKLNTESVSSLELGADEEYDIPVGSLVFDACGVKFGIELCEDLWAPLPPSTMLSLAGAQVILNLSASNETIAKGNYRRELVKQQSARSFCAYAYCSAGTKESTQDLIFSGHSLIAENGTLVCEKNMASGYMLTADIDLEKLRHDRLLKKTFDDCRDFYGADLGIGTVNIPCKPECDGSLAFVNKLPFVPATQNDRLERCLSIFEMQVAGLKKRLDKTGLRPVIGISGGLDSTLALLVCVQAVKELGRPVSDVVGITMPCFGTTDRTYNNAVMLMKSLGITCKEINIKDACMQHFHDIGHDPESFNVTYENTQARERTQVLMDYSGSVAGLVVGTGDLSELALGWCTYNGDHMSMYGVNASIPKTLVRWMIDSLVKNDMFGSSAEYLIDIIDTPISPELLPPDAQGRIAQKTESVVGPYALHDFFLFHVLRYGFAPTKIYALAKRAFKNDFDDETILKWLKTFYRRFFSQQFKRSCMPDGVKVGSVCLSPRGDWRMPSDANAEVWLKEIETL